MNPQKKKIEYTPINTHNFNFKSTLLVKYLTYINIYINWKMIRTPKSHRTLLYLICSNN